MRVCVCVCVHCVFALNIPNAPRSCAGAKSDIYVSCRCRSATGEAWHEVMMAVSNYPMAVCDPHSDDAGKLCGSSFAFPYFIAFYVLCSFLVSNKCIAVRKVATPLRELTCHMGSHSVTCHPAEVTFPPLPQPQLVLD